MSDVVSIDYIYPPNWNGNPMPVNENNYKKYEVSFKNYSDGTGESEAIKVDISEFKNVVGKQATRTVIRWIKYKIQGMGVRLEWDRAPKKKIKDIVAGSDQGIDGCFYGPFVDDGEVGDGTGDILLTTLEASNLDMYDITICFEARV